MKMKLKSNPKAVLYKMKDNHDESEMKTANKKKRK